MRQTRLKEKRKTRETRAEKEGSSVISHHKIQDDVSLRVFMEHLVKLAVGEI